MNGTQEEIAAVAARLVVEEGLDFGSAKRKALAQLDLLEGRRSQNALRVIAADKAESACG